MNIGPERRLLGWLEERDPGVPPARLRAAVAEIPYTVKPNAWPVLDGVLVRLVGPWTTARGAALLFIILAALVAVVGAIVYRPWDRSAAGPDRLHGPGRGERLDAHHAGRCRRRRESPDRRYGGQRLRSFAEVVARRADAPVRAHDRARSARIVRGRRIRRAL